MAQATTLPPEMPSTTDLQRSLRKPRTFISAVFSLICGLMAIAAMVPLFSVLTMLIYRGGYKVLSAGVGLFTELPPAAGMPGGGIGNAILGTLVVVCLASLVSVPVGILCGVYIAEFAPKSRVSEGVRFCAKVLTGLPSVLAGLVGYAAIVLTTGRFSAISAGVALAILMLPTIILTAEDAIKMVPTKMREAAVGMGCTPTQVVLQVVLPTATPGILTGVMLAVARAAGETAPLLFTALFNDFWMSRTPGANLMEPIASLAVLIYDFSASPFDNQIEIAWAASLVLVSLVLVTNIAAQIYTSRGTAK